jgi:stage II sporulation protein D
VVRAIGLLVLVLSVPGCERREIVKPTPQMDADARFWVRVLLFVNATECTITAPSAMYAGRYGSSRTTGGAGPMATPLDTSVKVTLTNGQLQLGATPQPGDEVVIDAARPHVFTLNNRRYRGKLRLTVSADRQTFSAVNLVPLEPYLAGVVGAEMPKYWEPEALKAQAIAARTYCLYTKDRFGTGRGWDVSSTQASQVYRGVSAESSQVWKAVRGTHGMILVAKDRKSEDGGRFPAYYSAICGGHTEGSRPVFGEAFGPLRAVPCPYCKDVARLGLFFWPMAQYDRETVTQRLTDRYASLKALGEIREIVVTEKSTYDQFSRLTRIRLVGATGKTDTLRGEDLRLALDPSGRDIQSTICQIVPWGDGWAFLSGRGWGHGVGMCQCGAQGMARQGKTVEDILQHYYPGSEIVNIY